LITSLEILREEKFIELVDHGVHDIVDLVLEILLVLINLLIDFLDLSLNLTKALLDGLSETVPLIVSIDVVSGLHYQDFDS
jgi:hypothetical protein